ncbi:MAG: TatD family hydrolase [Acholeplasmataceae bacterium]|nr:TatD family hydrolase [Acholeplasmataceae bacterium]
MIVDTHIHLYVEEYRADLPLILEEAKAAGVGKMIVVGSDYHSSIEAIKMAANYDFLYAAVGLHPSEVGAESTIIWLEELLKAPKVVAIGEIGLDYYWDRSHEKEQRKIFIQQLEIARKSGLPVIIHSREAADDTYRILKEYPTLGVLHCYSYSVEMAREFVKMGYYLGIGGVITFTNSKKLKEVVREIPLTSLLSETDGPYLAPHPFRGKINRPSYLTYIIETISQIKNTEAETVKEVLYRNAQDLFKI